MKKALIIGGSVLALLVVAGMLLKLKAGRNTSQQTTTETEETVSGTPPAVPLRRTTKTERLPEKNIISHMVWLDMNTRQWVEQIQSQYNFTYNQANAFLAIREGKFDNKDVPLDYAGTSEPNGHVAWVKKYVY